ncbi:MAG TPA: MFS transporter [Gemmatimonadales bacterium]|nr:MFS transporter [Gemmatimonadales bacterium]
MIPRTVRGLALVSFFNDVASEMVYPLLPAFVTGALGAGPLALGLLDRAADLTSAVVKWASGRMADRPGWRTPLILGGYLTAVLVRPLISLSSAAWQVIGFRVIDRFGKGLRTPPRDALIADVTPPSIRGQAFGFHRAADHLGAMLGSVVAWALLEAGTDVPGVIGWSAAPGLLAVLLLTLVLRGSASPPRTPASTSGTAVDATGKVFWAPLGALTLLAAMQLPEALLLLRLQERGVAIPLIPLVWGALHVVRSTASYPGGRLTDLTSAPVGVALGGVLFSVIALSLASDGGAAPAVIAFLGFGLVAGLTEPAERALVAQLAPVRTGRGFGAYHALTGLVAVPSGLAFGGIYQQAGGRTALLASAAGVLITVAIWLAVAPRGRTRSR